MKPCVLISGGFGYLGGRIALEIAQRTGWQVRLGSRQAQPSPAWLPAAETVAFDVLSPESLRNALQGVQAVVHLAAMNENECLTDPVRAVQVNTQGTLHVLQEAIRQKVERFLYFSTAHVYGAPLVGTIDEQRLPRPIHPYAITHHAAEDFIVAAHDQNKLAGAVIRLSNGFGAPTHAGVDRWTLLVNDLCRQAVTQRQMTLRSSGLQFRDFITLEDVGRAVIHFLELPLSGYGNGVFNVGGECSLTVWEMTQRIATQSFSVLGFTPEVIRPLPLPEELSLPLDYSIEKLKSTGFKLQGQIDQEIKRTLQLCQQALGNAK